MTRTNGSATNGIETGDRGMAKLKLPAFNEGSLLQRTLLYVGTFVVGSIGFVALASLLVVTIAKSVLPARGETSEASESSSDKPAEVAAATPGKPTSKIPRPKRSKSAAPAEPPAEATP
ncbi:hypothetical protein [Polyangium fumosum]|nr:hypothetical protein [Polyangium fumosum]